LRERREERGRQAREGGREGGRERSFSLREAPFEDASCYGEALYAGDRGGEREREREEGRESGRVPAEKGGRPSGGGGAESFQIQKDFAPRRSGRRLSIGRLFASRENSAL